MSEPRELFEGLKARLGEAVLSLEGEGLDAGIWLDQDALRPALQQLKSDGFNMLVDLTAVDFSAFGKGTRNPNPAPQGKRFKLVYRLMSLDTESGLVRGRVALFCWAKEKGPLSIRDLWPNADWLEREVWDMFGVSFADRPDIKRLLLYEEFVGHPLRKEYPINKRQPLIGPKEESARERMTSGDLRPRIT